MAAAERDGFGAQCSPDGVEDIAEAVPGAGFVAFRPEQGEQSLPGTAEIPAHGEHGERRLGPPFGQRWRRRARAFIQGEASEHPESGHADPCLSFVTLRCPNPAAEALRGQEPGSAGNLEA